MQCKKQPREWFVRERFWCWPQELCYVRFISKGNRKITILLRGTCPESHEIIVFIAYTENLFLTPLPLDTFANRADPDQAALVRAA